MNKNGTRTIQINEELAKRLSIKAIELGISRKDLLNSIIENYFKGDKNV